MHLRYPEGIRSTVDADLSVRGNVQGADARRHGHASRTRSGPSASTRPAGIFDFGRPALGTRPERRWRRPRPPAAVPLRFDICSPRPVDAARREQPRAPGRERRPAAARHLRSAGRCFGRAEVDRGEVTVRGPPLPRHARHHRLHEPDAHRAVLRRRGRNATSACRGRPTGSSSARPGRSERLQPAAQLRSAAAGRRTSWRCCSATSRAVRATPSCARCRIRTSASSDILTARATQLLASPISSEVGKVVEQTFGVDTFQLTPSLVDPYSQQTARLNPSARADDRQAHLRSRVPDVLAQPQHVVQRPDHPARVRRERPAVVDPVAQRGLRPTRSNSA